MMMMTMMMVVVMMMMMMMMMMIQQGRPYMRQTRGSERSELRTLTTPN